MGFAAARAVSQTNQGFLTLIDDLLKPAQTPDRPDAQTQQKPEEQSPGRASIAAMFAVQQVVPPPDRLPFSISSGEVLKAVAESSAERAESLAGQSNRLEARLRNQPEEENSPGRASVTAVFAAPQMPARLPIPMAGSEVSAERSNRAGVVDVPSGPGDARSRVSTTAPSAGPNLPDAELAFSAVLAPMQRPVPTVVANTEDLPEPAPQDPTAQSQLASPPNSREASAPVMPDPAPEPQASAPPDQEIRLRSPTTYPATRHSERHPSVDSESGVLVKPAAAISGSDGNLGARPSFQFTPPEPAGTVPNKQPHVSSPQPNQPQEPPEIQASPLSGPALQSLQIRVGEDPARAVELQVSEHAGSVHVAVRSADPELTVPLRLNLPSLVENLERRGYRAESLAVHETGPIDTTHSEPKAQPEQNGSWTGSQNDGRDDPDSRNRRKRKPAEQETQFSLSPIQENKL